MRYFFDPMMMSERKMAETLVSLSLLFQTVFVFVLTDATAQAVIEPIHSVCAIPNYDYFNLTAMYWYTAVKHPHCLLTPSVNGSKDVSECHVLMSFCSTLEILTDVCHDSSVCQQSSAGLLSLGAYAENPFITSKDKADAAKGFQAFFHNGSPYGQNSTSCHLETRIKFHCNESVPWVVVSPYIGMKRAPDPWLVEYDADKCEITLNFDYAGACERKISLQTELSFGSVMLIIFSIAVALYLILGCMVNISRGRSGSEIFPHSQLWAMMPVFVMDGIRLFFCCGRRPMRALVYEELNE